MSGDAHKFSFVLIAAAGPAVQVAPSHGRPAISDCLAGHAGSPVVISADFYVPGDICFRCCCPTIGTTDLYFCLLLLIHFMFALSQMR